MDRRTFICTAAYSVIATPLFGYAQPPALPVVGFLSTRSPEESVALAAAFRRGLNETDCVEGQNLGIEYRWAKGHYERIRALANELVGLRATVICAVGGTPSALAAKAATATIPIVFVIGEDPVKYRLVASLNRPGGNLTGVSFLTNELGPKRLGLLCEMVPN